MTSRAHQSPVDVAARWREAEVGLPDVAAPALLDPAPLDPAPIKPAGVDARTPAAWRGLRLGALVSAGWLLLAVGATLALTHYRLQPSDAAGWAALTAALLLPLCLLWLTVLAAGVSRALAARALPATDDLRREAGALRAEMERLDGAIAIVTDRARGGARDIAAELVDLIGSAGRVDAASKAISDRLSGAAAQTAATLRGVDEASLRLVERMASVERGVAPVADVFGRLDSQLGDMAGRFASLAERAQGLADALSGNLEKIETQHARLIISAGGIQQGVEPLCRKLGEACGKLRAEAASLAMSAQQQGGRIEAATAAGKSALDGLLDAMAATLDMTQQAVTAQSEAIAGTLSQWRRETLQMVGEVTGRIDEGVGSAHERMSQLSASLSADMTRVDTFARQLRACGQLLDGDIASQLDGRAISVSLLQSQIQIVERAIAALAAPLSQAGDAGDRLRAAIAETGAALSGVGDSLDATLAGPFAQFDARQEARLAATEALADRLEAVQALLDQASGALAGRRQELDQLGAALSAGLDRLAAARAETRADMAALGDELEALDAGARQAGVSASATLLEALNRVRSAAAQTKGAVEGVALDVSAAIREKLQSADLPAIEAALLAPVERALAEVRAASEQASEQAEAAARRVEVRLAELGRRAETVEAQLARAADKLDGRSSSDFNRLSSALIESLNSAAIDVAKLLARDLPDTDWEQYLKGDRSIFARRALRLVDRGERAQISKLHAADSEFRDYVQRYVRDFEKLIGRAMTERDGQPLAVTLLSSDLGKLYVALAQSIKRLTQ